MFSGTGAGSLVVGLKELGSVLVHRRHTIAKLGRERASNTKVQERQDKLTKSTKGHGPHGRQRTGRACTPAEARPAN